MSALRAKAPRYLGCAKNIIDPARHFIFWKSASLNPSVKSCLDFANRGFIREKINY